MEASFFLFYQQTLPIFMLKTPRLKTPQKAQYLTPSKDSYGRLKILYCKSENQRQRCKSILTGFKNATPTSYYIFQNTVECKLPLLQRCHHEVASSVNT